MPIFYKFAIIITKILRILFFRVSYEGRENIPAQGGYLVVCNHRSNTDPVFLAHGFDRQLCYMAKSELFQNGLLRRMFMSFGAFPVERGTGDSTPINRAVELLQQGHLVGLFPEGTRSMDGKLLRPKSGAALVTKMAQCGILPCAIVYEGNLTLWKKVVVRYGKPIPFEDLGFTEEHTASLKRVSKRIMTEIGQLMEAQADAD